MSTQRNRMIEKESDLLLCRRNDFTSESSRISKTGIEGLLEYRMNNAMEPLSLYRGYDSTEHRYSGKSKLAEAFEGLYGTGPFDAGSCDAIFHAWSFLGRFFRGMSQERREDERYVLDHLDWIFDGYEELRKKLDKLADYQSCLANLMPAPIGFRACTVHDGKGNRDRDNDLPDLYYKRARREFPEMIRWIDENMEVFSLQCFRDFVSGCEDGHADDPVSDDPVELVPFEQSVDQAIACIEKRAAKLFDHMEVEC